MAAHLVTLPRLVLVLITSAIAALPVLEILENKMDQFKPQPPTETADEAAKRVAAEEKEAKRLADEEAKRLADEKAKNNA